MVRNLPEEAPLYELTIFSGLLTSVVSSWRDRLLIQCGGPNEKMFLLDWTRLDREDRLWPAL